MSETLPVIRLPLPSVPVRCPSCSTQAHEWPLGVFAGQVQLTCPACHVGVAALVAVTDRHEHYPAGMVWHDRHNRWDKTRSDQT